MQILKIRAYEYAELNQEGKTAVKHWLDEAPIEVENDAGEFEFRYFSDMDDEDLQDHCESNGYLFTTLGRPIHHLERELDTDPGIWVEPSKSEEEQGITRRESRV